MGQVQNLALLASCLVYGDKRSPREKITRQGGFRAGFCQKARFFFVPRPDASGLVRDGGNADETDIHNAPDRPYMHTS